MIDALSLILTGFSVVMVVLAALWGACAAVGYFFTNTPPMMGKQESKPAPAAPAAAAQPASGVPPHHLVAIAAAVAETLGSGYVVTRVAAPGHKVSEWPTEGRNSIFSSHITRHGWGAIAPTRVG